jgi:threonyl-tRNA synthetase
MLVVGDKEVADRGVSPRTRDGKQAAMMPLPAFIEQLLGEARPPQGEPASRV